MYFKKIGDCEIRNSALLYEDSLADIYLHHLNMTPDCTIVTYIWLDIIFGGSLFSMKYISQLNGLERETETFVVF